MRKKRFLIHDKRKVREALLSFISTRQKKKSQSEFVFSVLILISIFFLTACTGGEEIKTQYNSADAVAESVEEVAADEPFDKDSRDIAVTEEDSTPYQEEADIEEPGQDSTAEENENESEMVYSPLEVHYIDVGEADSALIVCGDEAMLVDAGTPDKGTAIRLYMKKHNVSKLKYFLLTHSDKDHIGGAASVISNVDIDNLFMCKYEKDNDIYTNMINEINYKNMSWSTPEVGTEYTLGDAVITIIAPNGEYNNPNDSSIAFVIRHGVNSFIFTGDAESPAESDIVNNGLDISSDVYYVGHHGSYTSSTQEFLDKVNPSYAVISCGKDNEYGHPHVETMEKLKNMGVTLFRTDDQGTVIAYSDGANLTFNVEPSDNWANGNSETNESASTQVKNGIAEATAAAVQTDNNTEITYVLNKNSKKFHIPTCDSVGDMSMKNREDVTLSRDEVVGSGYIPCKRCNP